MIVEKGKLFDYDCPTPEGVVKLRCRMINSSNIKWIGWNGTGLMIVEFIGGGRYIYFNVTRQAAVACAFAESSGAYLNKKIKPHHEVLKIR